MKIECMFCGANMGEKNGQGVEGTTTSICEPCLRKYYPGVADQIIADMKAGTRQRGVILVADNRQGVWLNIREGFKRAFTTGPRGITL